jgi:hypothetical protein
MNPGLKYPEWQGPLKAAVLDFNTRSLREKLEKLENLLSARFEALASDACAGDERQALSEGFTTIYILKKQRLS